MLTTENEERWLTYAEAGRLLGISPEAARQLAKRRGWPRRTPNEHNAFARMLVPDDAFVRARPVVNAGHTAYERGMTGVRVHPDEQRLSGLDRPDGDVAVRALEGAVEALRAQLAKAEQRADADRSRAERAECHLEEERGRVNEERKRVDELRVALADAVAAERIAADEAAGLRAEVNRLIAESRRPWWRRWFR